MDISAFEALRLRPGHPGFAPAYAQLWQEFGAKHQMESRDVILSRLAVDPVKATGPCALLYELIALRREGHFAAARDHTAIVPRATRSPHAIVHLSHVLVAPEYRRSGVAGWLRALPLQAARRCLVATGASPDCPVTLVAEMEAGDEAEPDSLIRLRAYERAGFKKIDPAAVAYLQPDFRSPSEIDAGGGPRPLPFWLIVRRVGRESETEIRGGEVRALIGCLYYMYAATFRAADMAIVWSNLARLPRDDAPVRLLPPTAR